MDRQEGYLAQCIRRPIRVSRRSRYLPSHVLVIASMFICGTRRVFMSFSSCLVPLFQSDS